MPAEPGISHGGRMSVLDALDLQLRDSPARDSAEAATARVLAARLDDPELSAHMVASVAGELLAHLERLRVLAPPKRQEDRVDEIAKRRQRRVSRPAG